MILSVNLNFINENKKHKRIYYNVKNKNLTHKI